MLVFVDATGSPVDLDAEHAARLRSKLRLVDAGHWLTVDFADDGGCRVVCRHVNAADRDRSAARRDRPSFGPGRR